MTREFIMTEFFDENWVKMGLDDEDMQHLQNYILHNPRIGVVVRGANGLRKLRWSMPNTGKRGGARVLYIDFVSKDTVVLLNCYSKKEKDGISLQEKDNYKKMIDILKKELGV